MAGWEPFRILQWQLVTQGKQDTNSYLGSLEDKEHFIREESWTEADGRLKGVTVKWLLNKAVRVAEEIVKLT